jgi:altronate hydrolase
VQETSDDSPEGGWMTAVPPTLLLHDSDDVAIATADLPGVPRGHKVALRPLPAGTAVRKYGQVIGFATRDIPVGEHVHTHNMEFRAFEREYAFGVDAMPTELLPADRRATFDGIVRPDGGVATRNYIGVLTTVNCAATTAKHLAAQFQPPGALDDHPNVDGVVALTHTTGCGMAGDGSEEYAVLRRTLTGYARHPNFAGFLIIGLGCEVNQVASLVEEWDVPAGKPVVPMTIQELGGTRRTIA